MLFSQTVQTKTQRTITLVCRRAFFSFLVVTALLWLHESTAIAEQGQAGFPALSELTTVEQVHDASASLASTAVPVRLSATVTYYDAASRNLFIQDETGGVYVWTTHNYGLHRGDRVRIEGTTQPSFKTTISANPQIKLISHGDLRHAKDFIEATYDQLMKGQWDCRYVAVRGMVRSASIRKVNGSQFLELGVLMNGGTIQVLVQNFDAQNAASLLDARVEIFGVAAANLNKKRQMMHSLLYVTDLDDEVRVLKRPTVPLQSLKPIQVDDVSRMHSVQDQSPRLRVRGIVTYYRPGRSIVIQQDGHSLPATTRSMVQIPIGSVVDLYGFAGEGGYGPSLNQTQVVPTGRAQTLSPVPVTYEQAVSGTFSDDLISIQGRLLSQVLSDHAETLSILVDHHAVNAFLEYDTSEARHLPQLSAGTLVSLAGICRINTSRIEGNLDSAPVAFALDMRGAEDLRIIQRPSWWSVLHLLSLLAAFLLISFIISLWALVLRRQVNQQNSEIEHTIRLERERGQLLESISSECDLQCLLESINTFVQCLAPETCCLSEINDDYRLSQISNFQVGYRPSCVSFRASLLDSKGRCVGRFEAGASNGRSFTPLESKVIETAASLAKLAVSQRSMYEELNYASAHDQLTALPNRRSSDVRLDTVLRRACHLGKRAGVAYIDIDRFKDVNDRFGHKAGDLYLQQIAVRLSEIVEPGDMLARVGGDEFLLIANGVTSAEDLQKYSQRLRACFETSFVLETVRLSGSASIGIALYPDHGETAEDLKKHADFGMYTEKRREASSNPRPARSVDAEIFTCMDLENALQENRFWLWYQPQFTSTGKLRGVEALLRLSDPILGWVTPDAFINVVERSNLVHKVGAWVVRQALADAILLKLDQLDGVRVAVNVSAREVEQPGFAAGILEALETANLPTRILELEITERCFCHDDAESERQLQRLSEAGVRLALDDFGVEYSCLGRLHRIPIDTIKIDRSFVSTMKTDPGLTLTVGAICTLANNLNLRIVAEGVETEDDVAALLRLSDMDLQGYLFSRPQPVRELARHLSVSSQHVTL